MKPTDPGGPAKKLVMIVDDDAEIRELLKFLTAKEGFKVKTAADGESALAGIRDFHPDLILLDLMLPLRSGFDILRELQVGDTSKIPVIVITGYYTKATLAETFKQQLNVVDFLEKPVDLSTLISHINRVLVGN